jgi:membrane-associated phospholipid phosphatase
MTIPGAFQRFLLVPAAFLACLQGCGTMPDGGRWGADATWRPGWDRAKTSFVDAVTSPLVVVPAAAALLVRIDHADERISGWAVRHTPTTGSTRRAERLSSDLRRVMLYSFYLSALAAPSGDDPEEWCLAKAQGLMVQGSAAALNNELVFVLKDATDRERPNKLDQQSFPSGHASNSAMFATLASRNVHSMDLPPPVATSMDIALYTTMAGVAWERVESGYHYPSDVLAGIAMASFMGRFINDTFMGNGAGPVPVAGYTPDGYFVGVSWRF